MSYNQLVAHAFFIFKLRQKLCVEGCTLDLSTTTKCPITFSMLVLINRSAVEVTVRPRIR